jgi:hypothetical protein
MQQHYKDNLKKAATLVTYGPKPPKAEKYKIATMHEIRPEDRVKI